jgi:hypothetical protein
MTLALRASPSDTNNNNKKRRARKEKHARAILKCAMLKIEPATTFFQVEVRIWNVQIQIDDF